MRSTAFTNALTAFALASVMGAAAFATPVADYGFGARSGSLPNGGRYVFTPPSGAPVTAVELWFSVPSTGFDPQPHPSIADLAAQTVAASTPVTGSALGSYIQSLGGHLSIDVFPNSVAVTAEVPTPSAAAVVHQMTADYFSPVITADGLKRAKSDLATQAILARFDPDNVAREALFSTIFSSGPAHYPTLDGATLAETTIDDVKAFASRGFTASNASLIVSGSVDDALLEAAVPGNPAPPKSDAQVVLPASRLAAELKPVTVPFPSAGAGYAWVGPGIDQERDATALDFIADYLFNSGDGLIVRRAEIDTPDATISGQFITMRDPGVFTVSVVGPGADRILKMINDALVKMREPLAASDFAKAREAFEYHLQSDLQTPSEFAASLGWYSVEGNAGYAPGVNGETGAYFDGARALTPAVIAQAARRYLSGPPATVTFTSMNGAVTP